MLLADDVAAACEQLLEDAREAGALPGIVAAAFTAEGVVWEGRAGDAGRQYRIGSISKTFTAVGVMQLRDAGLLELDDPLSRHVPDAPYGRATLRDLLSHNSGLTAEPVGPWWERSPGVDWETLAERNRRPPQALPPRSAHHYSNLGYALLGEVVARHRSTTWYDAVRDHLLDPLGLSDTTYGPAVGAVQGTSRHPRSGVLMREPAHDSLAMAPAGQLWSTVADLARWGTCLVSSEDHLLSGRTLEEMRTAASATPETQHLSAYGLGLRLLWRPHSTLVGHTGSMPGFLAALFTDSSSGVGAAVLTNATTGASPEAVAQALIERVEPAVVAAPRTADAPTVGVATAVTTATSLETTIDDTGPAVELAGEWYWGNTEMTLQPTPEGFLLRSAGEATAFAITATDRYVGRDGYFAGERLDVVRRPDGSVCYLEVVSFVLTRLAYDPEAPIPGGPPEPLVSSPG